MDRPIVVLDTETANQHGAPHLLELGAVRVEGGEIVDVFESLVTPTVPIDPEVTAVHGIDEKAVREAPPPGEVLARFTEWVGDEWMAAHNARVDTITLGFAYARAGEAPPPGPVIDTLALAKERIPESRDHKLGTLRAHLELEDGPIHRALADATYCWKVLEECIERQGPLGELRVAELLTQGSVPQHIELPGEPRLSRRIRSLRDALAGAQAVTLLYGGEDGAPTRLPVIPRLLFERRKKGYLEAECQRTGLLKTYLLDRVQRILA